MSQGVCLESLFFAYEQEWQLENITGFASPNTWTAIIGPNGGGKTTLIKLILGFLKPQKGSVLLWDQTPEKFRPKTAYVPQITAFDKQFPLTVLELVMMGRLFADRWGYKVCPHCKKHALQALEKVRLLEFADAHFGSLSGGQMQRALLARALVCEPTLLILDEPTANLDPAAEALITEILSDLKKEMTILMVTHHLDSIINQIDQVWCVNKTLQTYQPEQICGHFTMGLYHPRSQP